MRGVSRLVLPVFLAGMALAADRTYRVEALERKLEAARAAGKSDEAAALELVDARPGARISEDELKRLQALAPGARTRDLLDFLTFLSGFLPAAPEPAPAEAQQLAAEARRYAATYVQSLPDFLCTRLTRHFDNQDMPGEDWRGHPELWFGLRLQNLGAAELSYAQGKEHTEDKGKEGTQISFGEFSGLLKDVLVAEDRPALEWLRWENVGGRRAGVFRFEVAAERSRYVITHRLGPGKGEMTLKAAYRGEVAVYESGAIARIAREAVGLPKTFPTKSVKLSIDYAPVRVDPMGLLFPVRSRTMTEVEQPAPMNDVWQFRYFNDARFTRYRRFGSSARLVGEAGPAAAEAEPESEPEPWIEAAPAQSADELKVETPLTLKTTTRLVEVPVSVYDAKGRAVRGLKAEDFRLTDNGQERAFTLLAELDEAAVKPPEGGEKPAAAAAVSNQVDGAARPMTVLVIRKDQVEWGDLAMARAAMVKFVKSLPDREPVPVFLMSEGTVYPLRDLESGWAAMLGPTGRPRGRMAWESIGVGSELPGQDLGAHATMARFLGSIPGPKRMLFVSSGQEQDGLTSKPAGQQPWDFDGQNRDDAPRRIGQLYNDANVTVYAIDPAGLTVTRADATIGLNALGRAIGDSTGDLQPLRAMQTQQDPSPQQVAMGVINGTHTDRMNAKQSSLVQLAGDTGGRALLNTNDLERALRTAFEDAPGHYRLGFYAPTVVKEGRFHQLRVSVVERQGLRLQYRRGYLEQERELSPEARLAAAVESPVNWRELKLGAELEEGKPGQLKVRLKVGAEEVKFRAERGRRAAQLEIHYVQKDRHGVEVDRVVSKVTLTASLGRLEEWRREGIPVEQVLKREPALARLTVIVKSVADGRIGTLQLYPPGTAVAQSTASTR